MKVKKIFQIISYLQYPLFLIGLYYILKTYLIWFDILNENSVHMLVNLNKVLILFGLGISFSTLQDTSKTQNNYSKKIWTDPKKGRKMIFLSTLFTFLILVSGIFFYFFSTNDKLKELSFGIIVFGIGLVGLLKGMIEMFENHRIDKKTNANIG